MTRNPTILLLLILLSLPASLASRAQPPSPAPAAGDTDAIGTPFEVATVRPSGPRPTAGGWVGVSLAPSGRLSVRGMDLKSLVYNAYAPRDSGSRVEGGASWVESQEYDIEAKVDESQMANWDKLTNDERMARVRPMLRSLLAERFQLKLHTEMRETPVYALVQAKGGTKLKQVPPPEQVESDGDAWKKASQYMADHPGKAAPGSISCSGNGCTGHAVQMNIATTQIGFEAAGTDRPVVDQTGLTGYYDFSYTISNDPDSLTPMQQIEDQLGLRFESRKIPMKTYVIDSAEKPTQN